MHISALVKLNLYEVANYAIWNDCRLRVTLLSHLALLLSLICTYIIYTNSRIFGINWYRTVWSTGTWSVLAQSNFGFSQWFTQHLRNLMGPNPSCWEIQPLNTIEPLMWGQPTSLWAGLWLKKSSKKLAVKPRSLNISGYSTFGDSLIVTCPLSGVHMNTSPKWIVAADLSCHVINPINKHISWTCFSDYRPKCQNFGCFVGFWLVDPSLLHGCHVVVPWWRRHEIPGAGLLGRAASPAWRMLCQDAALAGAGDSGDWSDWWVPSTEMPLVSMRYSCLSTWIMIYYDGFAWFWRWFWYHKNGPDMVEEFGMFVEVSIDDYRHRCIYTEHHSGKTVKDFKL